MTDPLPAAAIDETERRIAILDGLTDKWAEEVNLLSMIENVVSPMRLNRNAPQEVRDRFTHRMKVQIDAICRQCFMEGAMRVLDELLEERPVRLTKGVGDAG